MKAFVLFAILGWSCYAYVVGPQQQTPPLQELNGYWYALDLSQPVTYSTCQCIRQYAYTVVFLRAYSPAGQGVPDQNVISSIRNAYNVGLGIEVYMTPQPNSGKTGGQQFMEMYNYLTASGIKVRAVWVQVTSPINWISNTAANVNIIQSILDQARLYGVTIGMYTNYYDWYQITNGMNIGNTMLWYWHVYGPGISGESPSNFNDFRRFGGWNNAVVKQFAQVESMCGLTVNRDIYTTSSLMAPIGMVEPTKPQQIVVGNFGLTNTTNTGKAPTMP